MFVLFSFAGSLSPNSPFLEQKQLHEKPTVGDVAIFPDKISPALLQQPPRFNPSGWVGIHPKEQAAQLHHP